MTALGNSLFAYPRYRVDAVGPECSLEVGEIVTHGRKSTFDWLSGGDLVSLDVVRENGDRVTLTHGPKGARLVEIES